MSKGQSVEVKATRDHGIIREVNVTHRYMGAGLVEVYHPYTGVRYYKPAELRLLSK